jgi:hypothetical protein
VVVSTRARTTAAPVIGCLPWAGDLSWCCSPPLRSSRGRCQDCGKTSYYHHICGVSSEYDLAHRGYLIFIFRGMVATVDEDQLVEEPTLLKALLKVRHWQKRETFACQWDRVAKTLDSSLVGTCPAHAQFYRWLSGNIRSLPHPDACRILEAMFPGITVQRLFHPVRARRSELLEPPRGYRAAGNGLVTPASPLAFPVTSDADAAYLETAQQYIGRISARGEGNDSSRPLAVRSPTAPMPPSSNTVMSPWGVVSGINPGGVEPIDEAFITSIHAWICELLDLDAQVGGNETSGQALRLFRAVHRRIGVSPCSKSLRRDLYAAVGELAEVAGWLFYDADQQDSMRRINHEALYYLRWAGCRSLELLTLQNMSMQAEYLNRPSEALTIVQSVLEADRLSPRMESLFLARGAHALAQQQQADAVRTFQKARVLYLDGSRDDDPAWATWVDDRQFAWFEAMVQAELGAWDKSVHIFAEALATSPQHRVRGLYSRSVYLFESLVSVGDWREAEQLIPKLAPYIGEVGSGRTASILRKTLHTVHTTTTTPTLKDGAMWLQGVLEGV